MGILSDIKQKAQGEEDKLKGEVDIRRGRKIKGAFEKAKGKIKSTLASKKMRARRERY